MTKYEIVERTVYDLIQHSDCATHKIGTFDDGIAVHSAKHAFEQTPEMIDLPEERNSASGVLQ